MIKGFERELTLIDQQDRPRIPLPRDACLYKNLEPIPASVTIGYGLYRDVNAPDTKAIGLNPKEFREADNDRQKRVLAGSGLVIGSSYETAYRGPYLVGPDKVVDAYILKKGWTVE